MWHISKSGLSPAVSLHEQTDPATKLSLHRLPVTLPVPLPVLLPVPLVAQLALQLTAQPAVY